MDTPREIKLLLTRQESLQIYDARRLNNVLQVLYHQTALFLSHPNLSSISHPISLRSTLILQGVWIFVIKEVSSHLMAVQKLYRYFSSLLFQSRLRVVIYINNTNCKTPQTTISSRCPSFYRLALKFPSHMFKLLPCVWISETCM
jgi:hypothetical protein